MRALLKSDFVPSADPEKPYLSIFANTDKAVSGLRCVLHYSKDSRHTESMPYKIMIGADAYACQSLNEVNDFLKRFTKKSYSHVLTIYWPEIDDAQFKQLRVQCLDITPKEITSIMQAHYPDIIDWELSHLIDFQQKLNSPDYLNVNRCIFV